MRLDKFLSDMGVGTRSELKKDIKLGLVTINGMTVRDPGVHVTSIDIITHRGEPVIYEEFAYYMLNKPSGIISASEDSRETTVVDLIAGQKRRDLFPAGRLDRDTEGLLLITNDGELAHRLLSPRHHVDKVYYARISGIVTDQDIQAFQSGLTLADGLKCLPAELSIIDLESEPMDTLRDLIRNTHDQNNAESPNSINDIESSTQKLIFDMPSDEFPVSTEPVTEVPIATKPIAEVLITIHEGKFHQIKRMFQTIGHEVLYLKRLTMGPLLLDPALAPGEYRRLTTDEIAQLKSL